MTAYAREEGQLTNFDIYLRNKASKNGAEPSMNSYGRNNYYANNGMPNRAYGIPNTNFMENNADFVQDDNYRIQNKSRRNNTVIANGINNNVNNTESGITANSHFNGRNNAMNFGAMQDRRNYDNKVKMFAPMSEKAILNNEVKNSNEIKSVRKKTLKTEKNPKNSLSYDEYLLQMLNERNSNERLLSEEEYNQQILTKKSGKVTKKLFGKLEFQKKGKIFLGVYVIIVLLLASILLIANTSDIMANANAGASSISESPAESKIVSSMTIEEEDEDSNWFDRLCDGINK